MAYKIEKHQQNQVTKYSVKEVIIRLNSNVYFFSDGYRGFMHFRQCIQSFYFFAFIHISNVRTFEFVSSLLSLSKPYWLLYLKCISVVLSIVHNTFDSMCETVVGRNNFFFCLSFTWGYASYTLECTRFWHFSRTAISFMFFSLRKKVWAKYLVYTNRQ